MKLDYGSGYNPKHGFKTSDFTGSPMLDYHISNLKVNCEDDAFDEVHCRNVIHHIKPRRLPALFKEFIRILKNNGKLTISEPAKDFFVQNRCLDMLWYRFVIPRSEVYIGDKFVDFEKFIPKNFIKKKEFREHSNMVTIFKLRIKANY